MDGGFLYALAMQAIAVNAAGGDSTNFLDWNICGLWHLALPRFK
jgi:hypothetical protein